MSENIFEKNLQQFAEFQTNMTNSVMKIFEQFDLQKSITEMTTYQDKLTKGIKILMDMKPEDAASDLLEKEEVLRIGKMRLFHYKPIVTGKKVVKTPLLITYALVNRQYMMDIQPDRSVIKSFLEGGLDVYVIDWGYPTGEDMYMSMDDYINWYMDDCVNFIRKEKKVDKVNLLGVCQGGTFSTIYSALNPDKIKNLVTMVVPIDFSGNDALLFRWSKFMNIDSLVDAYGVVPGDIMNFAYLILKPLELTMNKYISMVDKMDDPEFMKNFMRMEKWVFDSPDQAGETLRQFIKDMYQGNKLIKNELVLGGKQVNLKNITMPLLCACAEYDHLVPLSASRPLLDAVGSTDTQFISFKTGHIGMYVSSQSQKTIAPQIVEWLTSRS
ncbi:MAG: class III poly(R)-hydroxyalkanoic acid synthase subunit PhaC [Spirochaetaceae bacterium]|nr:class III poly(R)-hydroxyalkanoic acid synthase subunit PhaC [Spirochaetaceae bacterium]MBQ7366618.1 class III poly(R)-hydroxyalkanoic acid synthase subunit PhaC [Spirochaetaceae bacterium]MBQ8385815.1 class III poly(R)-hydroxyalkanoic acid synthase subunit PhaC [Spirochaetaceae bacterium]MBQ8560816.1 class III poly(R)-hydroxyalkanoic acid synthase subunit PhaC [Spirochaetaceae bacterium]MBR2362923.1 class III poly(R)-hydroxyalkanoic acid synthase subunit PhaC [Spirochaetaceae bacterium]